MESIFQQSIQFSCRRKYLGEILENLQERWGLKAVRPRAIAETRPLTINFQSGTLMALLKYLAKELHLVLEIDQYLACFWKPAPVSELTKLEKQYRTGDEQARCEAVYDMASYADPRIYRTLMAALCDPSAAVVTTAFTEMYWNHASFLRSDPDTRAGVATLLERLKDPAWSYLHREILQLLRGLREPALMELLLQLAQSPDPEIVAEARYSLAESQDPRAFDLFLKLLKAKEPETRGSALRLIKGFKDKRCVPAFLAALKDKDPDVVETALWALGWTHDSRAFKPLVAALTDPRPAVRFGAIRGLNLFGDRRAVPPLAAVLNDKKGKSEIRAQAAYALGCLGGEDAVAALLLHRCHKDSEIRLYVKMALTELGGAAVLAAYQEDLDSGILQQVHDALQVLCEMKHPPAIDRTIAALNGNDDQLREDAVVFLSRSEDSRAVQAVLDLWADNNPERKALRSRAKWCLVDAREPAFVDLLFKQAGGKGGPLQVNAIESLNRLHDPRAETLALKYAAQNGEKDISNTALLLGDFRSAAASATLIRLLKSGDCFEYNSVASALVRQRSPRAVPALIPVLKHSNELVRSMVVGELGRLRDPRLIPPMVALLQDPVANVRLAAVRALSESGHATVAVPITSLKKDPDSKVRKTVREALKKLNPKA